MYNNIGRYRGPVSYQLFNVVEGDATIASTKMVLQIRFAYVHTIVFRQTIDCNVTAS